MANQPLYLDYNATTPVADSVIERMLPFMRTHYGNPSSKGHAYGWAAEEATTIAREELARLIEADPSDLVFTSGATEAVNLAMKGAVAASTVASPHVVTVATEHSAVIQTVAALQRRGVAATVLPVGPAGELDLVELEQALRPETVLVAVMRANNEVGTLQPIGDVSEIVRSRGVLLLTDATQAVGKIPVSVTDVDFLACSAHKFYGPKGAGALWIRSSPRSADLRPLIDGGGQEEGLRSGTLNVPGIVGLGAAADLAASTLKDEMPRQQALRDRLESLLATSIPDAQINSQHVPRLPQTSSMTFKGVRAANILSAVRELAVSAGSACSSGTGKPSRVLKAMGLSDADALATLRLSLGRPTTEADVDRAADLLIGAYEKERTGRVALAT